MITDERKGELLADLEQYINRYLDKQWVVAEAIDSIVEDKEEAQFLHTCNYYFAAMLPEDK